MDIDSGETGSWIGYGVGAAGLLAAIAQMAWQKFFSTEGRANDALVSQLSERLTAMETRQTKLEADLDEERRLRRRAEDKVHALELDNLQLRVVLKSHNIEVPKSFVVPDAPEPPVEPA